ncbi:MAG: insulinase family protein [Pirellulaceae bacterium]|nr:insulinase family protein [Pirellulaceae bacterium]
MALLHRQFDNGLILLAEPMPWLRSAAFTFMVPAGTCFEPNHCEGLAALTAEMAQRGCGPWNSRQFMEQLDALGTERSSAITSSHTSFSCAMPSQVLPQVLQLYGQLVQQPHLPEPQLEDARSLCLQDLRALEDEPSHRCFSELKRFRFPVPYGRIAQGTHAGLAAADQAAVQAYVRSHYTPSGSILAVAGRFDWHELCDNVERELAAWRGPEPPQLPGLQPKFGSRHVDHGSSQTHIALAYQCAAYDDPQYYDARALVGILSDGMSCRLFTQLRDKRGLVYSVFASCFSLAGQGSVLCYAGTTTSRAEETLQVLLDCIHSLGSGIGHDELLRLKTRIKSSLVFEQESSVARSSQIASDWYYLGRVPDRQEVCDRIDALTTDGLVQYFHQHIPQNFSLVTVGSQPLDLPNGIDHS